MKFSFVVLLIFSCSFLFQPEESRAKGKDEFWQVYRQHNALIKEGKYSEAEEFALKAYELGRERFGPEDPQTATLAYNVGFLLNQLRKNSEAKPYLLEAAELWENNYGELAIQLLDVSMELSEVFIYEGLEKTGIGWFSKAERIAKKEFGENSEILIDLNLEVANDLYSYSFGESLDFYQKAYNLSDKVFPEGHYKKGVAAASIGKIYFSKGKEKKTEEFYLEALEIFKKTPPPDFQSEVFLHGFLYRFYLDEKRKAEAEKQWQLVLGKQKAKGNSKPYPFFKTPPKYPNPELNASVNGTALIEFSINEEGKAEDFVVLEADSERFAKAAIQAIREWRYIPQIKEGKFISTEGIRNLFGFEIKD